MTPEQFRSTREQLGLTPCQAAPLLGFGNRSRIYEIENGKRGVSSAVELLLQAYVDGYRPAGWPSDAAP